MAWCCENILRAFLLVASALPVSIRGAPPYNMRHPRREPPCTHPTHTTLCWTVQLKQPLHFRVLPLEVFSQGDDVSHIYSGIEPSKSGSDLHKEEVDKGDGSQRLNYSQQNIGSPSTQIETQSVNLSDPVSTLASTQPAFEASSLHHSNSNISGANTSLNVPKTDFAKERFVPEHNLQATTNFPSSEKKILLRDKKDLLNQNLRREKGQQRKMDTDSTTSDQQKMYVYRKMAVLLAEEVGLTLLGKVGELYDHFVLCYEDAAEEKGSQGISPGMSKAFQHYHKAHTDLKTADRNMFEEIRQQTETALHQHHDVAWFTMETVHHRQKRSLDFNDPAFGHQWHLVNHLEMNMDVNVTGVWQYGITGTGVTVAVVDDGLEWKNPDLHDNYNFLGSWDLNDNDPDPAPNAAKVTNHHGTRCAGEIAAVANNSVCGVGVAYGAKVSGIRLLDGPMTDSLEAEAFNKKFDVNAIYSCSWGPDDDGKTVDGPHLLAAKAMKYGVEFGRSGYGSVFVVASGNGGSKQDNCNYDGYANSIYTVTIGAVDESGAMPYYAEECASMLGVTFSSGTASKRDIVTTDWQLRGGRGCTDQHTGTSAAAPLAAGMIALMLDAQPCLTWRDVQYILIITSVKIDIDLAHWQKNGAGLEHSHKHGFGLIKAWRLVNAARVWRSVPWMTSYSSEDTVGWQIPHGLDNPLIVRQTVTTADIAGYSLYMLEYVQVTISLSHAVRGKLGIHLRCPSGTLSVIGAPRPNDNSTAGFTDWTFTTVRCWGESPTGDWTLVITDSLSTDSHLPMGQLTKWRLTLFGTPMTTKEFQERIREVEDAMTGQYLRPDFSPHCDPPPVTSPPYIPLSEKTLKVLFLSGVFCVVFALYETMEYMMCYNEEKEQHADESRRATLQRSTPNSSGASSSEMALLLTDNSERDTEQLQRSQTALDENDDDMFLEDSGVLAGLRQARRTNKENGAGAAAGERIQMSTLRSSAARTDPESKGDHHTSPGAQQMKSAAETLPKSSPARIGSPKTGVVSDHLLVQNHHQQGASTSDRTVSGQNQVVTATEVHSLSNRSDRGLQSDQGPAKRSILPEMWRALTQENESDDSECSDDNLFSREDESSVSLLRNGVSKVYR